MSVLFAFLLAANPAVAASEPPAKKPRLRCEWIHEVGTSRPRRVCEKRVQQRKSDEPAKTQAPPPMANGGTQPTGVDD